MFQKSVEYDDQNLKTALEKVETFNADFGLTEIYSPLDEIFTEIKGRTTKRDYTSQVYLLTDGAVHNNNAIIELVKQNCTPSSNIQVHTFGVGSGADEQLIKGCAFAGLGNFSFIYKDSEIEEKVIESMSKSRLEYLIVNECSILDEDDNVLASVSDMPQPLAPGTLFNFEVLLEKAEKATHFSLDIYDPNTQKSTICTKQFKKTEMVGLLNSAVRDHFINLSSEEKIKASVKYDVLCDKTSLLAFRKIANLSGLES